MGPRGEALLWAQGVRDWGTLLDGPLPRGFGRARRESLRPSISSSERALAEGNAGYFAHRLPPSEHWRLYSSFPERTAFLDIETTGLSPREGSITCVTVHGGGRTVTLVQGEDLEEVAAVLRRFVLLVTFNGRSFDVPFLSASFPALVFPPGHADLMLLLRRLGQRGGLKIIEKRLGVGERSGLEGVDGLEAVRLWRAHVRGVSGALERLLNYNRADTVNLEPLMQYATREMERRLLHPERPELRPGATSDANLDPRRRFLDGA